MQDNASKRTPNTGCIAPNQGKTAVIFAEKYIRNINAKIPSICKYVHNGKAPINAETNMKIGTLNPNRWTKVTCFIQFAGLIKIAMPANKN